MATPENKQPPWSNILLLKLQMQRYLQQLIYQIAVCNCDEMVNPPHPYSSLNFVLQSFILLPTSYSSMLYLSYTCCPDILLPIFVLPCPYMQRGKTLGKLLSTPSAGHLTGWLKADRPRWGPMQATVFWGRWECQRPCMGAELQPGPKCHGIRWTDVETTPWKNGVVTAAKLVMALA